VMGYPGGRELTLLLGYVSSVSEPGGRMAISAPVVVGQAGSPVLNKNGEVIAVIRGGYSGESGQGIATPIRFSRAMLINAVPD
jgi:V8-like Glu-specific endopeptidase